LNTSTTDSSYKPSAWIDLRYYIGRGVTRFGELIARQGDRISAQACWTGDREKAWGDGYEFARGQLGLDAGRTSTKV
jgi:hypothetical protein